MDNNQNKIDSSKDKFFWIRDIIRANIISKLRGKSFANVIDIGSNTGTLLTQLSQTLPDSRLFAFPINPNKKPHLSKDIRLLNTHAEVEAHRYDLILSVFDIHLQNWLEVAEYLKFIYKVSDADTTILISDIETNTMTSKIMIKVASLFNTNLKSVISRTQAVELLKSKGFDVIDKDHYKINDVWSAWILTCKKAKN